MNEYALYAYMYIKIHVHVHMSASVDLKAYSQLISES